MLDVNLLRAEKGGDVAAVKESQRKRGGKVELIDQLIAMDEDCRKSASPKKKLGLLTRKARYKSDCANSEINALQKQIAVLMKSGKKDEAQPLLQQKEALARERIEIGKLADEKEKVLYKNLNTVGNLVHESVPDSLTEDDNAIVRSWWPANRAEDQERERRIKLIGGATVKEGAKGVPGLYSHHEILDMVQGFDTQRGNAGILHHALCD